MDVLHVSPVHHGIPDTIRSAAAETGLVERPMPIATALRWIPVGQSSAVDPVHPIFITRSALEAVQERAIPPADVDASFGFLVGEVYVAPETALPYVVVETVIHSGWSMPGDDFLSALLEARAIAEEEVRRGRGRLVGWYQTHSGPDPRLSAAGVGAHTACFDEPWAIALVVAGRHGVTGGVFRAASHSTQPGRYLPFYELLAGDSLLPGGRKVTGLSWQNYCAPGLAVAAASDMRPTPPSARVVLVDDVLDEAALATESLRRVQPQHTFARRVRWATIGVLGLVALAALFGAYGGGLAGIPVAVGGPAPGRTALADVADRLGDSVAMSVQAYDVRARLFAGRKMTCADLARGLVDVEQRWASYIMARAQAGAAPPAEPVIGGRRLQDGVTAVERRFSDTPCPRP